jgi:hypothetical protein
VCVRERGGGGEGGLARQSGGGELKTKVAIFFFGGGGSADARGQFQIGFISQPILKLFPVGKVSKIMWGCAAARAGVQRRRPTWL